MIFPKNLYVENVTKINYILESYQNYLDFKEAFPEYKDLTWGGKGEKSIFGDRALKHIDKQKSNQRNHRLFKNKARKYLCFWGRGSGHSDV